MIIKDTVYESGKGEITMREIILLAETGSDIELEMAAEYGIQIVPMHVSFDMETVEDGTFPTERILSFYRETGRLPKTSGSTPEDFEKVFDAIHEAHPQAEILYLAYSAVTTCSYQSGLIAAEGRPYVTALDTKQVSVGQCNILFAMAELLRAEPTLTVAEAKQAAEEYVQRAKMCFLPDNLEFLRAGGRVSNVAFLGASLLSLHPCIEILEGKLVATKKYRGKMEKVAVQLIMDYAEKYHLERERIWFVSTVGLRETVRQKAEEAARACGFREIRWVEAKGVITTHGGPGAFGLAGFSEKQEA